MIYPPDITISYEGSRLRIHVEGISYTLKSLAIAMNISETAIYKAHTKRSDESFIEWIKDKWWLNMRGYNMKVRRTVYRRGEERYTVNDIIDATGLVRGAAAYRGVQWQKGHSTAAEMLNGKKVSTGRGAEIIIKVTPPPIEDKDLGPRKSVDDITGPGTWEQENL